MFHQIPQPVLDRMRYLEAIDAQDRTDGTPRERRLRQVPEQTGRFIAILAATAPPGLYLEIGTSAGYSTMWLSLACRLLNRRLVTVELCPEKIQLARETLDLTGFNDFVDLVHGDAREYISGCKEISFCFLDAEKEIYLECFDLLVPRMVSGGILLADNAIDHRTALQPFLDRAAHDGRVDSLIVPVGMGVLLARKN